MMPPALESSIRIDADGALLDGDLNLPRDTLGIILFAHGSGSSRHSPRNRFVAEQLRQARLGTLLIDLLTAEEEAVDANTAHLRFDIDLLAKRLAAVIAWLQQQDETRHLVIGLFGASTGAAAALLAALERPQACAAVVSRGGRPDLVGAALGAIATPTLLIVGGADVPVIAMNQDALAKLGATDKKLVIVPGASHLFEEPGALEEVARLATDWFTTHLTRSSSDLCRGGN